MYKNNTLQYSLKQIHNSHIASILIFKFQFNKSKHSFLYIIDDNVSVVTILYFHNSERLAYKIHYLIALLRKN